MCSRKGEDSIPKDKQLENSLKKLVMDQIETHELWEIDYCMRILFDLSLNEE